MEILMETEKLLIPKFSGCSINVVDSYNNLSVEDIKKIKDHINYSYIEELIEECVRLKNIFSHD